MEKNIVFSNVKRFVKIVIKDVKINAINVKVSVLLAE
jgi:hypothetical protein